MSMGIRGHWCLHSLHAHVSMHALYTGGTPCDACTCLAAGPSTGKKRGRPKQEGSWASDRQRTNVKRGKFSENEKKTIREAVKE